MKFKQIIIIVSLILLISVFLTSCSENSFQDIKNDINDLKSNSGINSQNNHLNQKQENFNEENFVSISSILNNSKIKTYRRIDKNIISCISGNCPEADEAMKYFLDSDCPFCKDVKIEGETILASSSPLHWDDFISTCSEKHRFSYPQKFIIINKTADTLIVKGEGFGFANKSGSGCDKQYAYNISTEETWIFTNKEPEVDLEIKTEGPIIADALNYGPGFVEKFSNNGLIISCKSDLFKTYPWIELVQYNQYNASSQQSLIKIHTDSRELMKNPERFTFSSIYDGTFYVRPICKVVGKNSNIINIKKSDEVFKVIVKGAKETLNPDWIENNLEPVIEN